jgi:hypothetical protein
MRCQTMLDPIAHDRPTFAQFNRKEKVGNFGGRSQQLALFPTFSAFSLFLCFSKFFLLFPDYLGMIHRFCLNRVSTKKRSVEKGLSLVFSNDFTLELVQKNL